MSSGDKSTSRGQKSGGKGRGDPSANSGSSHERKSMILDHLSPDDVPERRPNQPKDIYRHLPDLSEEGRKELEKRIMATTKLVMYLLNTRPEKERGTWDLHLSFLAAFSAATTVGKGPPLTRKKEFEQINEKAIRAARSILQSGSEKQREKLEGWIETAKASDKE